MTREIHSRRPHPVNDQAWASLNCSDDVHAPVNNDPVEDGDGD